MPMILGSDKNKGAAALILKLGQGEPSHDGHTHRMPNGAMTGPEMPGMDPEMKEGLDMAASDLMDGLKNDNLDMVRESLVHFMMIYMSGHE